MSVRFYYGSGSPYAWRVWLALEHKGIPYHRKTLSFDAGDLKTAEFGALNPRRRVPVLVDDDFALAESAAIVEYIEERWPSGPALFAHDPHQRAIQRRMVREADEDLADLGQRLASEGSEGALNDLRQELALWEDAATEARRWPVGPPAGFCQLQLTAIDQLTTGVQLDSKAGATGLRWAHRARHRCWRVVCSDDVPRDVSTGVAEASRDILRDMSKSSGTPHF